MIVVSYYQESTNDAGEGLWRTDEEAQAHIERIKADFPAADITITRRS